MSCLGVAGLATAAALVLAAPVAARSSAAPTATLTWRGVDADRVSNSESQARDGRKDGHFTLVVNPHRTPISINALEVRLTDATGTADGSQIWDTVPNNGLWALAAIFKGRYVNALGQGFAMGLTAPTTIELYCGDSGYFTKGQVFRVTVQLSTGAKVRALATVGVSGPAATLTARYAGITDDRVGTGGTAGPDGQKDVHWALSLGVGARPRTIVDVRVDAADANGAPTYVAYWNTVPDNAWILGVYDGGKRLNTTDAALSATVSGTRAMDVYGAIASNTPLGDGQKFLVTVTFADGGKATAIAVK